MSITPATAQSSLPLVNQALEPEWVRHGSAATQKAYETALSFEETLVEQLSKSLAQTSGVGGEGSQESEGGGSPGGASELSSTLPQALTAGIMNAGGLGLAAQMTRGLADGESSAIAATTGGSAAQPPPGTASSTGGAVA